ncbi:holo-ACP synthase [Evansella sp. AB-rgal1]|uniref:holo-ACP synthase n=1 Tax=Evansella sp. AB-rgal1 TaxID=3242696 RepID=UPI00359DA206
MISGIGLDLVELPRIRALYERSPSFAKRILTEEELAVFETLKNNRKMEYLAGRFSAKEAFSKAMGTGIGKTVSFQDIQVLNDESGKPFFVTNMIHNKIHLSITHTEHYAAAQVIIES